MNAFDKKQNAQINRKEGAPSRGAPNKGAPVPMPSNSGPGNAVPTVTVRRGAVKYQSMNPLKQRSKSR